MSTTVKKINLFIIGFGFLAIYQFISELRFIRFVFTDQQVGWDLSMVLYFTPMFISLLAVILFWRRLKMGWLLMSAYFVYNIVNAIGLLFYTYSYTRDKSIDYLLKDFDLEDLFPLPHPTTYLLVLTVFGGSLWVIMSADIRNEFKVDMKSCLITLGVTVLFTLASISLTS